MPDQTTDLPELKLWNTLTRRKEVFRPINPKSVRMYVCGPTVYDFAHIGNARPVIVFDVLNRLLRHLYGEAHVTYVRNITDVDDKINARALRDFGPEISAGRMSLNDAIRRVTETTANQFQADVKALGCLEPDHQPRATEHISGMIEMAQALIDKGHAYVAEGREGREVLFDVSSMPAYGKLSNRRIEDQQAGARIDVKDHKRNPGDFVLWKQSEPHEPGWPAHFHFNAGHIDIFGRPGWHIECSVMSRAHLGDVFDIHGGGLDLIFPHHENEIAQSCCANGTEVMANVWMHNGFLQLEGKKMSKSDGNFVTINELLTTTKFGGRKWPGEVLRLAMLMTHYREPIDFSVRRLEEAENMIAKWPSGDPGKGEIVPAVSNALLEDLNTVEAIRNLHGMAQVVGVSAKAGRDFARSAAMLGILPAAKTVSTDLETKAEILVHERLTHLAAKNFAEADRIRNELAAQGIQLMDYKDPETGERKTKWEVKR
jgi:cysteinyl-tRNA synthetase